MAVPGSDTSRRTSHVSQCFSSEAWRLLHQGLATSSTENTDVVGHHVGWPQAMTKPPLTWRYCTGAVALTRCTFRPQNFSRTQRRDDFTANKSISRNKFLNHSGPVLYITVGIRENLVWHVTTCLRTRAASSSGGVARLVQDAARHNEERDKNSRVWRFSYVLEAHQQGWVVLFLQNIPVTANGFWNICFNASQMTEKSVSGVLWLSQWLAWRCIVHNKHLPQP